MKIDILKILSVVAVAGVVTVTGCGKKSDMMPESGSAEKAGVALDKAVDKSMDAAGKAADKTGSAVKKAAAATKDATGKVVEKTGSAVKKTGAAVEKTGTDMQK